MPYIWSAQDTVEPIAGDTIASIANFANYSVLSGCGLTYSSSVMTVTVAAGFVSHNGSSVTVAGNNVTLVADTTNPRWTWIGVNSSGTAEIVSGTAAATPTVPAIGDRVALALVYVQANLAIANNATYKLDKRVFNNDTTNTPGFIQKVKTSDQTFTSNTTLANITASSGNFAFSIAANEIWRVEYYMIVENSTGSINTAGAKFQLTGPALPTSVSITGNFVTGMADYSAVGAAGIAPFAEVTAFSTNIAAYNANNSWITGQYPTDTIFMYPIVTINALIRNGSTAGTVTLQGAQNTSSSNSTKFKANSYMRAVKVG